VYYAIRDKGKRTYDHQLKKRKTSEGTEKKSFRKTAAKEAKLKASGKGPSQVLFGTGRGV